MNALDPNHMTSSERLDQVAEILSPGLMQLFMRQSSPLLPGSGESSLELGRQPSGHLIGHVRQSEQVVRSVRG